MRLLASYAWCLDGWRDELERRVNWLTIPPSSQSRKLTHKGETQ
jgi:hypothetical protein